MAKTIWCLCIAICVLTHSSNGMEKIDLNGLFEVLHKVVNFAFHHKVTDKNFLLGIAIAKGQLQVAVKHTDSDSPHHQRLVNLEESLRTILEVSAKHLHLTPEVDRLLGSAVGELWNIVGSPQEFQTMTYDTHRSNSGVSVRRLLTYGEPNRVQSEACLSLLLHNCSTGHGECLDIEMTSNNAGYSLTHQVLYLQIARQLGCTIPVDVNKTIREKCERIYEEHLNIFRSGIPLALQDIIFEQIAVCGMEGFLSFLTPADQDFLLSLQTQSGCFLQRDVRSGLWSSEYTDSDGCDLHLTAVCSASAAVFIKTSLLYGLIH